MTYSPPWRFASMTWLAPAMTIGASWLESAPRIAWPAPMKDDLGVEALLRSRLVSAASQTAAIMAPAVV